jgi:hypothetical protein
MIALYIEMIDDFVEQRIVPMRVFDPARDVYMPHDTPQR